MIKPGQRWKYTTKHDGQWYIIEVMQVHDRNSIQCMFLASSVQDFARIGKWGIFADLEKHHEYSTLELLDGQDKPE